MMQFLNRSLLISLLFISPFAFAEDVQKARAEIQKIRTEILEQVYSEKPSVKKQVESAPGYATFDNASIMIGFGAGGGSGVVYNAKTQEYTYMNMAEVRTGLGLGIKNFRALFVFNTEEALNDFIEHGWTLGSGVGVGAVSNDKGIATDREVKFDDISVYQITKSGLSAEISLKGTKYWKNDELN